MNKMDDLAAKGANDRLYMDVARQLVAELVAGTWPVGSRLPAERELAALYQVSRPTAREAVIALEVRGFVEVRTGSGIYVVRLPGDEDIPGYCTTAFELTESRLLIEGETAALAATQITDAQLAEIEALIEDIDRENQDPKGSDRADRQFHLAVARAADNSGLLGAVTNLWDLRESSAEAALLHAKARTANIKPVVEEHTAILDALKARDPEAARAAMRAHLLAVMDGLLLAAEGGGDNQAKRERYVAQAR
jgi:GntR family transcriptional regulator, hexuronate regulon transcriptional repressor